MPIDQCVWLSYFSSVFLDFRFVFVFLKNSQMTFCQHFVSERIVTVWNYLECNIVDMERRCYLPPGRCCYALCWWIVAYSLYCTNSTTAFSTLTLLAGRQEEHPSWCSSWRPAYFGQTDSRFHSRTATKVDITGLHQMQCGDLIWVLPHNRHWTAIIILILFS